jgi:Galactose oxidase-like, Early set domain/Fibronectin type III domain/Glyoxal oxidase N-terminus
MQPARSRKSLAFWEAVKPCSCSSERLKVRLVALRCFVVAHFIGVSSASAQDPATVGQFSSVMTWPYEAIHAHLLPTGKVLFETRGDHSQLWNPETNLVTPAAASGANIFCSGHAFLPNGQLLVAGGHVSNYVGLPNAYTYNPLDDSWTRLPDMNNARWYPTNTTLSNGDVLVIAGWIDTTHNNAEPQVWQSATASWRNLTTAHLTLPFYPFMFVAPNGKVFCAGPSQASRYLDVTGSGAWSSVASNHYGVRDWGSSVMYDDGKVLVMGGSPCGFYATNCTTLPTASAEIVDLNSPTPSWQYTGSMVTGGRKLHNATLLADGTVLVSGGSRGTEDPNTQPSDPAYECELWDPATGTWTPMASLTKKRTYHSIALLLPDGRVLSAGGDFGGASAEVYSPPYLFHGSRPTITSAPMSVGYGESFFVGTPDATSISNVTLIALSSVTHGFNMGQRISRPQFSQATGGLNVTAPSNPNRTPPGYYMLFILNSNGVPSVAKIVQMSAPAPTPTPIPTPTPTPPAITSLTYQGGAFDGAQLTLGSTYTVTAAANSYTLSVIFVRDNVLVKTDSAVPYNWNFTTTNLGPHVLHVTPYSSTSGTGIAGATYDAAYTVVNSTPTPTPTPTPTATATPTQSPTPSPSATPTPTDTPTPTPTDTPTPTPTATDTPTPTPTPTDTPTPTPTATDTPTPTPTPTDTPTPTPTETPTPTPAPSPTPTPTDTPTVTPTATPTPTSTDTPTPTPTASPTATPTPTPTPSPIPAAPTNLMATAVSRSQINLSWTDNSDNETGFKVERSKNGRGFSQIATLGANVTTYSSTGLSRNTTYYYWVRAYNTGGNSAYSNIASATTNQ